MSIQNFNLPFNNVGNITSQIDLLDLNYIPDDVVLSTIKQYVSRAIEDMLQKIEVTFDETQDLFKKRIFCLISKYILYC